MAIKKIGLSYEGEEVLIDAAIEALAIEQGWTIDSVLTKEETAKANVNNYIRAQVEAYNVRKAQEAAKVAAQQASLQALNAITVTFEIE
jgi:hypothetical protein